MKRKKINVARSYILANSKKALREYAITRAGMTDVNPLITILYKDEELKTLLRRKGLRPMTKEESAYCTGWGVLAAWTLQGITDKRLKDKALVTLIEKSGGSPAG